MGIKFAITGKLVETIGLLIAAFSGIFLLKSISQKGFLLCIAIYLLSRFVPSFFNFLKFFAEVPAWPNYVSIAVAALFACYTGGWHSVIALAGLATIGDGRMFDSLY